jgi:hypothetical protein
MPDLLRLNMLLCTSSGKRVTLLNINITSAREQGKGFVEYELIV